MLFIFSVIVCIAVIPCGSYSQNRITDSLLKLIRNDKADTIKITHLNDLAWEVSVRNIDTAIIICNDGLILAEKIKSESEKPSMKRAAETCMVDSYSQMASFYYYLGNYLLALEFYGRALNICEETDKVVKPELNSPRYRKYVLLRRSSLFSNIAAIYYSQGDYSKASEFYFKALHTDEKLQYKPGISSNLGNIGCIYKDQGHDIKALEYFMRALKIAEELKDKKLIAAWKGDIGNVYQSQKNYSLALKYLFSALENETETQNVYGSATVLGNIGLVYKEQAEQTGVSSYKKEELYKRAFDNHFRALKIFEGLGAKNDNMITISNIGSLYLNQKKYSEAEKYLLKGLAIAKEIGSLQGVNDMSMKLSQLYSEKQDFKKAVDYYKLHANAKDSLFNQDKNKELVKHEMNYEFEKKTATVKAEQDKKDAVSLAENKKQRLILILVASVLFLVFIFAGSVFRSLAITKKQKLLIEIKNKETEEQKTIIEEKNREVLDSIHYAKRIQNALMPTEIYIERNLKMLNKN